MVEQVLKALLLPLAIASCGPDAAQPLALSCEGQREIKSWLVENSAPLVTREQITTMYVFENGGRAYMIEKDVVTKNLGWRRLCISPKPKSCSVIVRNHKVNLDDHLSLGDDFEEKVSIYYDRITLIHEHASSGTILGQKRDELKRYDLLCKEIPLSQLPNSPLSW